MKKRFNRRTQDESEDGLSQALPVVMVPFDESVEVTGDVSNMSFEQYMSWVRTQANRMPKVFRIDESKSKIKGNTSMDSSKEGTSSIKTKPVDSHLLNYMPVIEEIKPCPIEFIPSQDWQREVVHQFSELRLVSLHLQLFLFNF